MKYFTYILKSQKDSKYYVGITHNLQDRLAYHNAGKVRSTKSRLPFKLVYNEEFQTRQEARAREVYFKSYKGAKEKLSILKNL